MTFTEALKHFVTRLEARLNVIKAGGPGTQEARKAMEPEYAGLSELLHVFTSLKFNTTQDKKLLSTLSEATQRERVKKMIIYLKLVLEEQSVPSKFFNSKLPRSAQKHLWDLRQDLLAIYRISWGYTYPKGGKDAESKAEGQEVMNEAIQEWTQRQAKIPAASGGEAAFTDFKRLCAIQGTIHEENANIQEALTKLVQGAERYTEQEKQLLKAWLSSYGGQEGALYLAPVLFNQGHFQTEGGGRYMIGKNQLLAPNWYLEEGKIHCSYEQVVRNVVHYPPSQEAQFIYMDANRRLEEKDDLPENSKDLPPLLHFKVKLELNVTDLDKGVVKPQVKTLEVTSYTSYFISPEETLKPSSSLQSKIK
jgi:hypothetical protein